MGNTNNTVEINGKRYDAVTGAVVTVNKHAAVHHAKQHAGRGSIDGFARVSRAALAKPTITAVKPKPTVAPAHFEIKAKPHTPASHTVHHKRQRAVTLMRTAVKKPEVKAASVIKAQTRTDLLAKTPSQSIVPKKSIGTIDKFRHQRAERMERSPAVSRFSKQVFAPAAVVAHAPKPARQAGSALDFISTGSTGTTAHATPAIQRQHESAPVVQRAEPLGIFEEALANATSHEQTFEAVKKPKSRKGKRAFGFVVASLAVLLLVGFLGYLNAPQISIKVASYRSGLEAKLPSYHPDNYAFKGLEYSPGNVTASYASTTGGNELSISQRASNWNSQTLLGSVMSSVKNNYKTYQQAGRTIYVLGNNTATWVDSGILYTVTGNSDISSSELLQLATSL